MQASGILTAKSPIYRPASRPPRLRAARSNLVQDFRSEELVTVVGGNPRTMATTIVLVFRFGKSERICRFGWEPGHSENVPVMSYELAEAQRHILSSCWSYEMRGGSGVCRSAARPSRESGADGACLSVETL